MEQQQPGSEEGSDSTTYRKNTLMLELELIKTGAELSMKEIQQLLERTNYLIKMLNLLQEASKEASP